MFESTAPPHIPDVYESFACNEAHECADRKLGRIWALALASWHGTTG